MDGEFKAMLTNNIGRFYGSLSDSTQDEKKFFGRVYDVLFRMMNVADGVDAYKIDNKLKDVDVTKVEE